ncbi:MAG: 3-hydroxybutyrate dehydrogenase [Bdellovibrionaceae bacterium]|nr:3-hydroxybutyrate dehydrogenase [Pseudobdellovibrionaceae bacterium]
MIKKIYRITKIWLLGDVGPVKSLTMHQFSNQWALVTGSSSGIGWGIAQALANQKINLILQGLESIDQVKDKIAALKKQTGAEIQYHSIDFSDKDKLQKFLSVLPHHTILINNAGLQFVSPIQDFPLEKWELLLQLHLTVPFQLIQNFLKQKNITMGRIINISSVHGLVASVNKSAYVSAKHGLIGLSKSVALETAGTGVTCNSICPGWVKTQLVENQILDRSKKENVTFEQASIKLLEEKQPSKTFTEVSDIAELVLFLCSPAGKNITGASMTLDGGWTSQ